MSQYPPAPPAPPVFPGQGPIEYAPMPPKASGLALTAMILGIASIPLMCVVVGAITAIVAIVLGIIALSAISKNPQQLSGRGFAIAGIATGAGAFVLFIPLIALLLPSLGKSRELSNRSVCAANLRGIAQSMNVYAADNNDDYPIVSTKGGYGLAAAGGGTPLSDAEKTIVSMYTVGPAPSIPQNLWLLVLTGQVAPKQFLCKSDPASVVTAAAAMGGTYATNFNDGSAPSDFAYSYSVAYPWKETGERGNWWRSNTDASLPLIADMVPYDGTGSPPATPGRGMDRNANSFNHQRDGQNIGFGDAHAEFARRADVGQSSDNMYAASGGRPSPMGTPANGRVPAIGTGGTPGAWDICMVPAADANAGYRRK